MADDEMLEVNDATFDEQVLKNNKPVVVDFWAPWCGPCKMIVPLLSEMASESGDKYTVAKVNIDESPKVASQYNVMSVPTLLVFKNGDVTASVEAMGDNLKKRLEEALGA